MREGDTQKVVPRPIRVVQMLPGLEVGGVERGTLEMGAYLSHGGHVSIVISGGGRMVGQLVEEGSRHLSWRVGQKSPVCLGYIMPLRRLLVRERVDILHLRSRLPAWIGYAAWKSLPQHLRPRLVTTFHGFYSVNRYSAVMAKGEKVIAISRTVRSHIEDAYGIPSDRIVVIPRGFDENLFAPELVSAERMKSLRSRWALGDATGPVVMLPGRLTRLKGHDIFFKSLARLRQHKWTAVCVGDTGENPGYAAELRAMLSRLGLEGRAKLVGYCDDMPAALMLSDVVVSATHTEAEAFGRIAVEAQAMGKPVIASAQGGSLETVLHRKTGWLVTPGDHVDMADALAEAMANAELRSELGRNGRKWVKENFTVERTCRGTLDVYMRLLGQPSPISHRPGFA